jgi:hypothetical protein
VTVRYLDLAVEIAAEVTGPGLANVVACLTFYPPSASTGVRSSVGGTTTSAMSAS